MTAPHLLVELTDQGKSKSVEVLRRHGPRNFKKLICLPYHCAYIKFEKGPCWSRFGKEPSYQCFLLAVAGVYDDVTTQHNDRAMETKSCFILFATKLVTTTALGSLHDNYRPNAKDSAECFISQLCSILSTLYTVSHNKYVRS